VNGGKSWFTGALPELWLYVLGAVFIFVTLFMPRGIAGVVQNWLGKERKRPAAAAAAPTGAAS
jgi:urea transport system permease protein